MGRLATRSLQDLTLLPNLELQGHNLGALGVDPPIGFDHIGAQRARAVAQIPDLRLQACGGLDDRSLRLPGVGQGLLLLLNPIQQEAMVLELCLALHLQALCLLFSGGHGILGAAQFGAIGRALVPECIQRCGDRGRAATLKPQRTTTRGEPSRQGEIEDRNQDRGVECLLRSHPCLLQRGRRSRGPPVGQWANGPMNL